MSSPNDRPYQKARSAQAAVEEIVLHAGTHFDPRVVTALLQAMAPEELNDD